ncbi:hypothetical protein CMI37_14540 [Candidatus Pacearchaeota archaeon]|nr:hypothetical protein [Candidatus Pacearchaeota archaeon]
MEDYVEALRNHGAQLIDIDKRMVVVEEQNRTGLEFHKDIQSCMTDVRVAVGRIEGKLDVSLHNGGNGKSRVRKVSEGAGLITIAGTLVAGIIVGILKGLEWA